MKPKTLLIVVLVLAALAAGAYVLNRPKPHAAVADTRIGQPVIPASLVERAARVEVSEGGKTVRLRETGPGSWVVESYHDLPADFSKLSTLVSGFTSAKVERLVTQNPERISRLEFSDTRVALADADGKQLVSVTLGKYADGGGRFLRYADNEFAAYLARINAWIDASERNWADSALLKFSNDDIAGVTITFASGEPLSATRADKSALFSVESVPEGRQFKSSAITSLLGTINSLRFTETVEPDAPEAVGAREHARTVTLTTFDGKTITVAIGRQPERTVVKADVVKPDPAALVADIAKPAPVATDSTDSAESGGPASVLGPVTETLPAGPVFAFISHSDASAPVNALMTKRAFQIGEFVLSSLPADRDALFETVPAPEPSPSPTSENSPEGE